MVVDEYGNYYEIIAITEGTDRKVRQVTLANAFMEHSYRDIIIFANNLFQENHSAYDMQYIGKIAMDSVKARIEFLSSENSPGKIWPIEEVKKEYDIKVEPFFERKPEVKA
jgi:hypothetical protein